MTAREFLVDLFTHERKGNRPKKNSGYPKFKPNRPTLGQWLADMLAEKVGSWTFLIIQSVFLSTWIILNSIPGAPHWDESPFILLNLVFSFASAYTAPIVLMSQNRQSDIDRQDAAYDHEVNLKAGQDIEWLHEKMDELKDQQLARLTLLIEQQQALIEDLQMTLASKR